MVSGGVAVRRFLGRLGSGLTGAGQPPRKRVLRVAASVCLLIAVVLLGSAAILAVNQPSTKRPLPRGVVYNVPLATAAATPAATPASETTSTPSPQPTDSPSPQPTWAVPTLSPTPAPDEAPLARLVVPAIKVNAPVSFKGVDTQGVMQDPNSWNDVAYYDFSGKPGFGTGNNAVFAGHVDYIHHGAAVFWDLNKLKPGDDVHVMLQDGTDYAYRVTQMAVYNADDAPVEQILGDTPTESVTLITCNGTFAAGHYNNRLVVRAERPEAPKPLPQDQISPGG